jgi:hypothetical protein
MVASRNFAVRTSPDFDPEEINGGGGAVLANHINSAGLLLDIAGAVMLFRYGLPAEFSRSGHPLLTGWEFDPEEAANAKRYQRLSWVALGLLVGGFFVQLVSNYLPADW